VPFDIAPPKLPSYGEREPLGYEPLVEGGTPPYTFTISGLPAGVQYDPTTGTLSGEPTLAGSFSLSLTLKDSAGNIANGTPLTMSLTVVPPEPTTADAGTTDDAPSSDDDGGNPSGGCTAPVAQLAVSVSASECTACATIAIVAESPQISAVIDARKSPCTETDTLPGGSAGCLMEALYVESMGDCGGSACGPYTVDLSEEFFPVSSGAAESITDTVSFCPFDGSTFAPIGTCASSLPMQCESDATITVIIDGS
jgi:Putative Ig domain